jgi:FkbM family methyltransferase
MTSLDDLLEEAENQWFLGDWEGLSSIQLNAIIDSNSKVKLALFAALGLLQTGKVNQANSFILKAKEWGATNKLISKMLISGVYSTIGRAYMAMGLEENALEQINKAMEMNISIAKNGVYVDDRLIKEAINLGLLPQAAKLIKKNIEHQRNRFSHNDPKIKILEIEMELLSHELSLAQQRQQIGMNAENQDYEVSIGSDGWKERLKRQSVSQLGQDLWVLERTGYKRGGFFVEFGATDGVLLSNTWLLEKEFGWNGICTEPNPKFFAKLKKNRYCTLSDQCISGETGKVVDFVFADAFGGSLEYADADMHKDKRSAYIKSSQVAKLKTISLHDFLLQKGAPYDIDYISIDTEGSELEILAAFPFSKWNVKYLTVEHNFTQQRIMIKQLLESVGYRCYEKKWDDWYEKCDGSNSN